MVAAPHRSIVPRRRRAAAAAAAVAVLAAAVTVTLSAGCYATRPTEVVLKSGQVLGGEVRGVDGGVVDLLDKSGEELPLPRTHVRVIEGDGPFADPPLLWRNVPSVARDDTPPTSFVRATHEPDGTGALEVAFAGYELPGSDRRVYLVGAVHVAHAGFFQAMQGILDSMDLVLWEGVGGKEQPTEEAMARFDVLFKSQMLLKNLLNLDFQLAEMDYKRPFWRNSDMSINDLQAMLTKRGLSIMPNEQLFRTVFGALFTFVDPEKVPRNEATGRGYRALIAPLMADPEGMLQRAGAAGLKEVLIDERNRHVIDDLRGVLAEPGPERIAIFYGAGHLTGMDRALREELGLKLIGMHWVPAWRF